MKYGDDNCIVSYCTSMRTQLHHTIAGCCNVHLVGVKLTVCCKVHLVDVKVVVRRRVESGYFPVINSLSLGVVKGITEI